MAKRDNTVRLADKYELSDLEPGVDPARAAAFLADSPANKAKAESRNSSRPDTNKTSQPQDPKLVEFTQSRPSRASKPLAERAGPWTSRTMRIRQSTATRLTKAACHQKMKQAEGALNADEPVTVQEIADHGIRLALAELGYDTT